MTAHAEAYQALMLDHVSGSISPARQLLVETHIRLRPAARLHVVELEAAGGALLEGIAPVPVAARLHGPDSAEAGREASSERLREARALIEAACHGPAHLNWRWRAPAMREVRLPVEGASLLRLAGGRSAPTHGHTGEELTLVLRGNYADETGVYMPGDIAFADADLDHGPYVPEGGECVCLVATEGTLLFHGLIARIANKVLS